MQGQVQVQMKYSMRKKYEKLRKNIKMRIKVMTRPENIQQYFKNINKSVTKLESVFQVKRKNPKKQ